MRPVSWLAGGGKQPPHPTRTLPPFLPAAFPHAPQSAPPPTSPPSHLHGLHDCGRHLALRSTTGPAAGRLWGASTHQHRPGHALLLALLLLLLVVEPAAGLLWAADAACHLFGSWGLTQGRAGGSSSPAKQGSRHARGVRGLLRVGDDEGEEEQEQKRTRQPRLNVERKRQEAEDGNALHTLVICRSYALLRLCSFHAIS